MVRVELDARIRTGKGIGVGLPPMALLLIFPLIISLVPCVPEWIPTTFFEPSLLILLLSPD